MITCREANDVIAAYLDGTLGSAERAAFEVHVRACEPCLQYLASYERTIRLGKAAFDRADDALPPSVPEDLVRAILAARRARR